MELWNDPGPRSSRGCRGLRFTPAKKVGQITDGACWSVTQIEYALRMAYCQYSIAGAVKWAKWAARQAVRPLSTKAQHSAAPKTAALGVHSFCVFLLYVFD